MILVLKDSDSVSEIVVEPLIYLFSCDQIYLNNHMRPIKNKRKKEIKTLQVMRLVRLLKNF